MQLRKLIERRLRRRSPGVDVSSDVHAVVAANVGKRGAVTTASSAQTSVEDGRTSGRDDPA